MYRTPRGRRRIAALAALAALTGAAAVLPGTGSAATPRLITGHQVYRPVCVPGPQDTVRAKIRVFMSVVNYHGWGDWADHMEVRARLESATPGLNLHSNWTKQKSGVLVQDKRHARNFRVVTDNKSGTADWNVHVKLIWHRPAPISNVTKDFLVPFDESCAPVTGGGATGPNTGRGGRAVLSPRPAAADRRP
jgi:hypothetical protein